MVTDQIVIYQTPDGVVTLDVKLENETIWLSLTQLSTLFEKDKSVISRHLKNIFREEELHRDSVVAKNATTARDGKTYEVEYFNLDTVISVGYRVNSKRGTQFRIWANKVLKEYLVKGYVLNEQKLKEQTEQLYSLKQTVHLLDNVLKSKELTSDEATGLSKVVTAYSYGSNRIADNALVALTLMIAESKPDEKDIMVKVVVNLINFRNE